MRRLAGTLAAVFAMTIGLIAFSNPAQAATYKDVCGPTVYITGSGGNAQLCGRWAYSVDASGNKVTRPYNWTLHNNTNYSLLWYATRWIYASPSGTATYTQTDPTDENIYAQGTLSRGPNLSYCCAWARYGSATTSTDHQSRASVKLEGYNYDGQVLTLPWAQP